MHILQIMAIVVIVLGVLVSSPFQIVIRENPKAKLPKLRWYKWLLNPLFYLVSYSMYCPTATSVLHE